MTRETSYDNNGGGGGGSSKKFLYNGPARKGSLFDDDLPTNSQCSSQGSGSMLNSDVWSITKNIPANSLNRPKPGTQEGWTRNAQRGFYSRHGGLTGEESNTPAKHTNSTTQDSKAHTWGGGKSFSYGSMSNGTNMSNGTSDPLQENSHNNNNKSRYSYGAHNNR